MSNWRKIGLIFKPQKKYWWMQSHAMLPTPLFIDRDRWRIYFSGRDDNNQSHIGYAEIDIITRKIMHLSPDPVLSPGELGSFDDSGVTPSSIVQIGDAIYLYYIGWQPRSSVRMGLIAGLAISDNGGECFVRYSKGPLLERTDKEPLSILTAPCVIKEERMWRMWYVSGNRWINPDLPQYDIKYAESTDGIKWERTGLAAVGLEVGENALARPWVKNDSSGYKMWYSYKSDNYQIGCATSSDGYTWTRKDSEVGIGLSDSGWDSEMIEYAAVIDHKGIKYMFYNGNEYGKYGIGLAVEEK